MADEEFTDFAKCVINAKGIPKQNAEAEQEITRLLQVYDKLGENCKMAQADTGYATLNLIGENKAKCGRDTGIDSCIKQYLPRLPIVNAIKVPSQMVATR